mmetsp:Transcript_29216/g.93883  ORF Transcript_29216/g.93883 Transcript_29216/m.93883 type:complete len:108 (-) Transcript_29216:105-428(-)
MRPPTNIGMFAARDMMPAATMNRMLDIVKVGFRPKVPPSQPAATVAGTQPAIVPETMMAVVKAESTWNSSSMNLSAPDMLLVSIPKRNPPIPETMVNQTRKELIGSW